MAVPKGKQGADITVKAYKQTNMSSEGEQFDSCDVPGALIEKLQSQWAPCLSSEPHGFQQLCKYVLEDGEPYAEPQVEDTLRWLRQSFQGHKAVGIISSGIR